MVFFGRYIFSNCSLQQKIITVYGAFMTEELAKQYCEFRFDVDRYWNVKNAVYFIYDGKELLFFSENKWDKLKFTIVYDEYEDEDRALSTYGMEEIDFVNAIHNEIVKQFQFIF